MRLNAADELAGHTRLQLLIALDQFPGALESIKSAKVEEATLEEVYCLYKTGREKDALALLEEVSVEVGESRAAKLLEAQIVSIQMRINYDSRLIADNLPRLAPGSELPA